MKYKLFLVTAFILVVVVYFIDLNTSYSTAITVGEGMSDIDGFNLVTAGTMLKTFTGLLFFQVEGIPDLINFLLWPVTGMFTYMLIDIVKDLIPWT